MWVILSAYGSNPQASNLAIIRSWLMQSKPFDKSVNMAPQTSFLSRTISIFSTMERSAFWVLKPMRKSHWYLENLFTIISQIWSYVILCAICCHLSSLKNVKSTNGGVLLLARLQAYRYLPYTFKAFEIILIGL